MVEVFAVSESAPGSPPGPSPKPQSNRSQPPASRAPIPLAIPLSSTSPGRAPTSEDLSTPQPSAESPGLAAVGESHADEGNPDSGATGGKEEMAVAGVSGGTGPLILPGGGYQVPPKYPEAARRMGIEGITVLKVRIREDGAVGDVIVAQSAGAVALDQAAVDAVQRWRFEPARRGGHPVAVWVSLPVRFRLE